MSLWERNIFDSIWQVTFRRVGWTLANALAAVVSFTR